MMEDTPFEVRAEYLREQTCPEKLADLLTNALPLARIEKLAFLCACVTLTAEAVRADQEVRPQTSEADEFALHALLALLQIQPAQRVRAQTSDLHGSLDTFCSCLGQRCEDV